MDPSRLYRAYGYIDAHWTQPIVLAQLAAACGVSPFHFHRQFKASVGERPHEHVRRLRLERAAFELVYSRHAIKRIGFDAGFATSAAFTHAFRTRFGCAPTAYRTQHGASLAPARRARAIAGVALDYRREPDRWLVYTRRVGPIAAASDAAWEALQRAAAAAPDGHIGILADYPGITAPGRMRNDACRVYASRPANVPEGCGLARLPGGDYAVASYRGRPNDIETLHVVWEALYRDWAPPRGWQLRSNGAFERFESARGRLSSACESIRLFVPLEAQQE